MKNGELEDEKREDLMKLYDLTFFLHIYTYLVINSGRTRNNLEGNIHYTYVNIKNHTGGVFFRFCVLTIF